MIRTLTLTLFAILLIEIYSLRPHRSFTPKEIPKDGMHVLKGIIHVHSEYSGGSGSPIAIAQAASLAGMDFVVLTDLNLSTARAKGQESRYGDLDLFVEMEASTSAGHALSFYSHTDLVHEKDEEIPKITLKHFTGESTKKGHFIVVAHPSSVRESWSRLEKAADGIELVNFDSLLQRQVYDHLGAMALTFLIAPLNEYLGAMRFVSYVDSKPFEILDSWNQAFSKGIGILGHNTYARIALAPGVSWDWPGYSEMFRLASNIVFLPHAPPENFNDRKAAIYAAISQGRVAILFQFLHPFYGNDWKVKCLEKVYRSGEEVPEHKNCEMHFEVPESFPYPFEIRLYKDTALKKSFQGEKHKFAFPIEEPGTYRAEVWARPTTLFRVLQDTAVPYVFYNPIMIKK